MPRIARHTPELSGDKAVRLVAVDAGLLPDIGDALTQLTQEFIWTELGDPVSDIVSAVFETVTDYYDTMLVGLVSQFLASIPPGWLQLDGSTYSENDYPILYARLPSQFKSGSNFTLPDMTDVFPLGATNTADLGDTGGLNSITLTEAQLPVHTHTEIPALLGVDVGGAGPPLPSATVGTPIPSGPAGSGASIDIRPAFVEVLYGIYAGQE